MSSSTTSDPTEAPFNTSFNVSDHLKVPEGCVVLPVFKFKPWDNPDNLISQEVEEMFDMIVAVVFLNIFYLIRCARLCVCVVRMHERAGIRVRACVGGWVRGWVGAWVGAIRYK